MTIELAIVGAGPWGVAVLDRLVTTARRRPELQVALNVIDPAGPGPGVHRPELPSFLLLNTVSGQIDSFSASHFGEAPLPGAASFVEWLRAARAIDADPHGFLPRALFGEYLRHVVEVLQRQAPCNLALRMVRASVSELSLAAEGRVRVVLDDASSLTVDHAFVCTGHGLADSSDPPDPPQSAAAIAAYPVAGLERIEPGSAVGIAGIGLVAVDVVAALTHGRGGRFIEGGDGALRYLPSGREPVIYVHSRTGTPFACRPAVSFDLSTVHRPLFCTEAHLAVRRAVRGRAGLQLEEDVLAPICAEMRSAYLFRALAIAQGEQAAAASHEALSALAFSDVREACLRRWPAMASFCPEQLLMPDPHASWNSAAAFAAGFEERLDFDVAEARKGEAGSPYKYALEMLRVLRPFIREGVEFDALAPASRRLFHGRVAPRIQQLVVGPPVSRGREWLALMRCGLLRPELGPSPAIERDPARGLWRARSRAFDVPLVSVLEHWVHGRALQPVAERGGPSLLSAMVRSGLVAATPASTACIDRSGHPIDATGLSAHAITLLGVPVEGNSYFNHYLPSPRSRARAYESIQIAIDELLSRQPAPVEGASLGVGS
jgi:hypothetical protein